MNRPLFQWRIIGLALIMLITITFPSAAYTQAGRTVTLAQQQASIAQIFKAIKAQTGLTVFYSNRILNDKEKLDVSFNKTDVDDVLTYTLRGKSLSWSLKDKFIVIQKAIASTSAETSRPTGSVNKVNGPVQGRVIDESGQPLPGVSVKVKNTSVGTVTGADGRYQINTADDDAILVFSYIGFNTIEVPANKNRIDVVLTGQANVLEQVVVVGYGTQKRSDITGSVASVPKERLQNLPVTNVFQAVEGAVAGLNINTASAAPGQSVEILSRGQNTFGTTGAAQTGPLIVVDGIPITSLGGLTNDLNPNDIASIEVLKDPSAVAIYGTRGANGVILITTKRGTTGKARISYNAYAGPEYAVNMLTPMSGAEYVEKNLEFGRQTSPNAEPSPVPNISEIPNYEAGRTTDWIKEATQMGLLQDHNVSISGGTADIKYYVSGEYLQQKGVVQGYQYRRASIRSNIDATLASWLKVGASLLYASNNYDGGKVNFLQLGKMSPYSQIRGADGKYIFFPMAPDTFYENPFLGLNTDVYNRARNITGNFYGEVKPAFLPGLKYRLNASGSFIPKRTNSYVGRDANNPLGSAAANNSETNSWILENILTYDRTWKSHHIDVTALYGAQRNQTFSTGIAANTFINDQLSYNGIDAAAVQKGSSQLTEASYLSQMLRINYSFKSKYLFTATARRDGYSAFGANTDKYGMFPSVALGWNISEENFLKNVNAIDNIKLRASYGKSGNQAIDPYRTISQLGSVQYVYSGVTTSGVAASILGNRNLKWETTVGTNIGIDFSLFKNRLSGTIDAYSTHTSDILASRQIPTISGYSAILDNIGETKNRGIEVTLNTVNIKNKDFTWRTSFNMAVNRNKIVSIYGDGKDDIGNRLFLGRSLEAVYDYKLIGVWQTGEDPSQSDPGAKPGDLKFEDINKDGKITTDDRTYLGNSFPKFSGGLTNTFTYKQFSLNVFVQGVTGVLKNNPVYNIASYAGRQNLYSGLGYWTPTNGNNTRPSLAYNNSRGYNYPSTSNFLRVKDITFSYRLGQQLIDKLNLSSALIYVSGRNLGTFTNWFGFDPQYASLAKEDLRNYPAVATYVLGLNVSLK